MTRMSYRTVLRAKNIRPIPAARKLRSSLTVPGAHIVAPRRELAVQPVMLLSIGGQLIRLIRRDA